MNWRLSLALLSLSLAVCHDFVDAQNATAASVLTSSLTVPSDRPSLETSKNVLAAGLRGNGDDGNNDNDQGDDGDDPSDGSEADLVSLQVDAATSKGPSSTHPLVTAAVASHSTNNKPQAVPTPPHPHTSHSRSLPQQSTHFTFHPHPIPTASLDGPDSPSINNITSAPPPHPSHHQPPVAIAFEVIGGLALLSLILCCSRCVYKYKRMPERDRISAVVDRHRLERELEEMEEAQPYRRRTSLTRPPPPAYQNAPAYEDVSDDGQTRTTQTPARSEHEEPPPRPP